MIYRDPPPGPACPIGEGYRCMSDNRERAFWQSRATRAGAPAAAFEVVNLPQLAKDIRRASPATHAAAARTFPILMHTAAAIPIGRVERIDSIPSSFGFNIAVAPEDVAEWHRVVKACSTPWPEASRPRFAAAVPGDGEGRDGDAQSGHVASDDGRQGVH